MKVKEVDNIHRQKDVLTEKHKMGYFKKNLEDGSEIGGSWVHFPSAPVKHLANLRNRVNSQRYSCIYEDQRPKIEGIERSDGKKSA